MSFAVLEQVTLTWFQDQLFENGTLGESPRNPVIKFSSSRRCGTKENKNFHAYQQVEKQNLVQSHVADGFKTEELSILIFHTVSEESYALQQCDLLVFLQ